MNLERWQAVDEDTEISLPQRRGGDVIDLNTLSRVDIEMPEGSSDEDGTVSATLSDGFP